MIVDRPAICGGEAAAWAQQDGDGAGGIGILIQRRGVVVERQQPHQLMAPGPGAGRPPLKEKSALGLLPVTTVTGCAFRWQARHAYGWHRKWAN